MADNGNGNLTTMRWAIGVGASTAVAVIVIALNVAASTYSSLGEKLDKALVRINDNTVAITAIKGRDDNLEWRLKSVEDQVCEIKRVD